MKTRTVVLSALVLLAYSAAWAGEVRGTVVDWTGAVVTQARVSLRGNHKKLVTQPNDRGDFEFTNVADGEYTLIAEPKSGSCMKKYKKKLRIEGASSVELKPVLQENGSNCTTIE